MDTPWRTSKQAKKSQRQRERYCLSDVNIFEILKYDVGINHSSKFKAGAKTNNEQKVNSENSDRQRR